LPDAARDDKAARQSDRHQPGFCHSAKGETALAFGEGETAATLRRERQMQYTTAAPYRATVSCSMKSATSASQRPCTKA
jgi:hypothetical protein